MSNLPQSSFDDANDASVPDGSITEPPAPHSSAAPSSRASREIDLDPYYDIPCTD